MLFIRTYLTLLENRSLFKRIISSQNISAKAQSYNHDGKSSINRSATHIDYSTFESAMQNFKTLLYESLAQVLVQEKITCFLANRIEMQTTLHKPGDFFSLHQDNCTNETKSRKITFVYYLHSIPKKFSGGELILYPTSTKTVTIPPDNNSIIFFDSSIPHEVKTINGCL